jgi:hypothetical protein
MKKPLLSLLITFLFTNVFQKLTFCQIDNCSNNYSALIKTKTSSKNTVDYSSLSGIVCNPNTFFALDNVTGDIHEVLISGTTTAVQSVVLTGAINGIGFCDNLSGGSFSPTFYSTGFSNQPNYYDGMSWVTIPSGPSNLYSQAGYGNNLFYTVFLSGIHKEIVSFNGSNFTTIYSNTSTGGIGVSDLAVDNAGNIYFLTYLSPQLSDSLHIISPTGNRIATYPFVINFINSYGAFMLNGIYYIGFGSAAVSPSIPDALLPISFTTGLPVIGNPISLPSINYSDLASCDPGFPLGINNEFATKELNIYPNPFSDETTISFNREQNNTTIKIIDILGNEIKTQTFSGKQLIIEKDEMMHGIYFIQITDNENRRMAKKIIVQ